MAGAMPVRAAFSRVATPELESQKAFVAPEAVVPKRGGERAWKANFRRICEHQANFLAKYGLTAEEVPVLRYDCGPGGPHGGHPFTPATAPVGECFVEVPC